MKAIKLDIVDKEHEIAILLSEEEAKQVCILFGRSRKTDHEEKMGLHYWPLDSKVNEKGSWHSRLWSGLADLLYGGAAEYREETAPYEK
jgi:hypothetical protein